MSKALDPVSSSLRICEGTRSGRARPEFLQCTWRMPPCPSITRSTRETGLLTTLPWTTSTSISLLRQARPRATSRSNSSWVACSSSQARSRPIPSSAAVCPRCEAALIMKVRVHRLRRLLDELSSSSILIFYSKFFLLISSFSSCLRLGASYSGVRDVIETGSI